MSYNALTGTLNPTHSIVKTRFVSIIFGKQITDQFAMKRQIFFHLAQWKFLHYRYLNSETESVEDLGFCVEGERLRAERSELVRPIGWCGRSRAESLRAEDGVLGEANEHPSPPGMGSRTRIKSTVLCSPSETWGGSQAF